MKKLPEHMQSLQRCTCWAERGIDCTSHPNPKCKQCKGTGSYIPKDK